MDPANSSLRSLRNAIVVRIRACLRRRVTSVVVVEISRSTAGSARVQVGTGSGDRCQCHPGPKT